MTRASCRKHAELGVSLIEVLVIVVIVGLIAAVAGDAASGTYRKWLAQGAATEVSSFLSSVAARAVENHTTLFLRLADRRLTLSRNQDGTGVLGTYTFPDYIALSRSDPAGLECSWPADPAVTGARILSCDPNSVTMDVTTGRMVNGPQTIVVTHRDIASGTLKPRIVYTVGVSPLWRGYVNRTVEQ